MGDRSIFFFVVPPPFKAARGPLRDSCHAHLDSEYWGSTVRFGPIGQLALPLGLAGEDCATPLSEGFSPTVPSFTSAPGSAERPSPEPPPPPPERTSPTTPPHQPVGFCLQPPFVDAGNRRLPVPGKQLHRLSDISPCTAPIPRFASLTPGFPYSDHAFHGVSARRFYGGGRTRDNSFSTGRRAGRERARY